MDNYKWCKCPNCYHKLFRYETKNTTNANIEIKCSSCKVIVDVVLSEGEVMCNESKA